MTILKEFIDALSLEVNAIKKGKGGNEFTIYNGELLRQVDELYIYQFTLENFLVTLDDTPANIEINGKEYDCDIVSTTGQSVQIAIKRALPETIRIAKLKTNTWFLLERLQKKFEETLYAPTRFANSNKMFGDCKEKIDGGNFQPSYSNDGRTLNQDQQNAITSSINDFFSIIWGPPGTGKTQTISKAIESHLNLGRTVLLLSHSNNAVDQALIKVADQTRNSYYKEGMLVRLGIPKVEMTEKYQKEDCNLVMIENIAEFKSKELIKEKESLVQKLEKAKTAKEFCDKVTALNLAIVGINTEYANVSAQINQFELNVSLLKTQINKIQLEIADLKDKLARANTSGFLKRTLLGLDPAKIEMTLSNTYTNLGGAKINLNNFDEKLSQNKQRLVQLENSKKLKDAELIKLLSRAGKSLSEVQQAAGMLEEFTKKLQARFDEINKALDQIKIQILKDAKLVATTLTKSYISKEIENIEFDILFVDEASMAPMPMLYWAASKIKKGITIVGDFKQLPPICISGEEIAKKWLGKSIFDQLGISEINKAVKRVQPLLTQYRMHPDICEIVNNEIYDGRLNNDPSVRNKYKLDSVSGNSAICLVDTSAHNPWCSQLDTGGRFNLISALTCVSLAEKILKSIGNGESIGIITPYRSQARLIFKILEDRELSDGTRIRVNTVHSFQGGEETVIIFDSVEGEGAKRWSIINEYNNTESAKLLLNVAFTRAQTKLYVVANCEYIKNNFESNSLFMGVLRHFVSKGIHISSTNVFSDLRDENFEYWSSKLSSLDDIVENHGTNYDDQDFWVAFHNDLAKAKSELIIFSPYLTSERLGKLHLKFSQLLCRNVKISVVTLSPNDRLQLRGANEVVSKLKAMNITVKFREGMHEKIAIIDRKIEWSGSLNILSHNDRKEYMKRFEGERTIEELLQRFDLEQLLYNQNLNGEVCPKCKENNRTNFIRPKRHYGNSFYGCTGFPECNFTAELKHTTIKEWQEREERRSANSGKPRQATPPVVKVARATSTIDLFANKTEGKQWESPKCYWSSVELPGYKYSKKKDAWWKDKPQ